jgi:hypothetical protein
MKKSLSNNNVNPFVPNVTGPPVKTLAELPYTGSHIPKNAAWRRCLVGSSTVILTNYIMMIHLHGNNVFMNEQTKHT